MDQITKAEKERLVDKLLMKGLLSSIGPGGGVGYYTKKLKGRDREVMKQLTAKDFERRIK